MRRCHLCLSSADASSFIRRIGPFEVRRGEVRGVIEVFAGDPQHPIKKLNLLGSAYFAALPKLTELLSEELNAEARVAIFTSREGCSFSGGIDLKELAGESPLPPGSSTTWPVFPTMRIQQQHRVARAFQDGVSSLARCRVPVIAAMDRHCIGGATSIASACDLRYATASCVFSIREAAVGLAADIGVLQRLPAIIGEGRTRELAYTCRDFDGTEARAIGLVEEVCADYGALLAHARRRATQIAANSPLGVQNTKRVLNRQRERAAQESLEYQAMASAMCIPSHDIVEAASAFAEKRTPAFTDYVVNSTDGTLPSPPPKGGCHGPTT